MTSLGPSLSAVICTRNRALLLRRALAGVLRQDADPRSYEIIVVDNGSTDGTRALVESMRQTEPELRYVLEPEPGLSRARNAGLQAAGADIVAYLDDDAVASPGWVTALLLAFDAACPVPGAIGGRVALDWGGPPPSWRPPRYQSLYSMLDHGDSARWLGSGEHIAGANMAFRRDLLIDAGGFDLALGRRGGSLLSGEEAAAVARLRAAGHGVYYEPAAAVLHAVSAERRRRRWLWRRMFWDGASQPVLDHGSGMSRAFYARHALYDLRRLAELSGGLGKALMTRDPAARTDAWLGCLQRAGRLRANVGLALRAPK